MNGSLDAELSRLVACAFDAEMHALELQGDTRTLPQRRAKPSNRCAGAAWTITTTARPAGAATRT
jgi:hypothetical protein